jgi:hypothetical protein
MQTDTIRHGGVILGTISFENGASALGMEVVATSAFPAIDGCSETEQLESYDAAVRFLHYCYEAHCEAQGVAPVPRAPVAAGVDEEAAYYAQLDAQEAEETAYHEAQLAPDLEAVAEENGYLEAFIEAKPELPSDASDGSEDDDLPF